MRVDPKSPWLRRGTLLSIFVLILPLSIFVGTSPVGAITYNCFTSVDGHCYAKNGWEGDTTGAYVVQYIDHILAASSPGRITHEMWLQEDTHLSDNRCGGLCWVETGISWAAGAGQGNQYERYFEVMAADFIDPNGQHIQYFWENVYVPAVPTSHYYNYVPFYLIGESSPTGCCRYSYFHVQINWANGVFFQDDLHNPMNPHEIDVGTEISGNGGACQEDGWYGPNGWMDTNWNVRYQTQPTPYGLYYVGSVLQGNYQDVTMYGPQAGNFATLPSQTSYGGQWHTAYPLFTSDLSNCQ